MCGRYYETATEEVIKAEFDIKRELQELPKVVPRFNISPLQTAPIVRLDANGDRELVFLRWGLIPSWANDNKIAFSTINARSETVAEKPSFRNAFKSRRCLVPASGFFEWQRGEDGKKVKNPQPFKFEIEGEKVFAFAGLYESWKNPDTGSIEETFTIVTTDPNECVEELHDRMPVILPKEHWSAWLDQNNQDKEYLLSLLKPFPHENMKKTPVSKNVNSPRNDSPDLIEALAADTLF